MIEPKIGGNKCPHCGGKIEIEVRKQAEFLLGPIGEVPVNKKKLDRKTLSSLKSAESAQPPSPGSSSSDANKARFDSVNRLESDSQSNRTAPDGEEEKTEAIREIVGELDWSRNSGLWIWRLRNHQFHIGFALDLWKLRSPALRAKIQNPARWLTFHYKQSVKSRARNKAA